MGGGEPGYKELTLQQLRSFCETARLGSFKAAAAALELSHPTVWKQVHALEREFGLPLVETHGRGCALTPAGRMLADMAGPAVESIATLRKRFDAESARAGAHLTIAVTPRMLVEDIAPLAARFRRESPGTRFTFLELPDDAVAGAVESRYADFGMTPAVVTDAQRGVVREEVVYVLEVRLVTPEDHPLARRRSLHPRDLRAYPLVNGSTIVSGGNVRAELERHGVLSAAPFEARASLAASIRRLVELGFGIGLIPTVPSLPPRPGFFERSMSRHLGVVPVRVIRRRGAFESGAARRFVELVRSELGAARASDVPPAQTRPRQR